MTKLVCISDTHRMHRQVRVPDGDILIHSGDFLGRGSVLELGDFLDWMEEQPHETKLVVPGNHDVCVEFDFEVRDEFAKSGIELLIDCDYTHMRSGLSFYGVPWTPDFYPDQWGFQYRDCGVDPERLWDQVPDNIDVIISHGPPHGCADQITPIFAPNLGSVPFRNRIEELKTNNLRTVICGHIHGSYGVWCTDHTDPYGVMVVNASICTEQYKPTNAPIVVNL